MVSDKILDTASYMEHLYILTDGMVNSIDMVSGEQLSASIEGAATSVHVCDKNSIVIGYSNMAKPWKTGELFAQGESK